MTTSKSSIRTSRRPSRIAGHTHRRVRVELPIDVFEDIRAEVGRRNVPHYLAETVEAARRQQAMREWLAEMDEIHGPVSEEDRERARRIMSGGAE